MTESRDERDQRIDRELEQLRKRMERVEGELGITSIDPAGIPDRGERITDRN